MLHLSNAPLKALIIFKDTLQIYVKKNTDLMYFM